MTNAPLHVVELARQSDTGRVRDHNEDRAYAHDELVAVADGMGGAAAGEVAAQLAIRAIRQLTGPIDRENLRAALLSANEAIRRTAQSDPTKVGMGTTMTAVAVDDGTAQIVHVGDSRAYLWREGSLRQLTDDHSVVGEMVRRGTLTADEALHHPHRNVITRALGADPEIEVDATTEELRPDDVLLLCSDGLYTEVENAGIAAVLASAASIDDAARTLVERANAAGGADNVTVVLARIGYGPRTGAVRTDGGGGTTQEHPVLDAAPVPAVGIGARVLEPASTSRRRISRNGLLVGAAVLVVLLMIGGAWWAVLRSFTIQTSGGTVWVDQGIKLGPLDLTAPWQDTGVPTGTVGAGQISQQLGSVGGEGATVRSAVAIVWADGMPVIPRLKAAAAARAKTGG